MPAVIAAAKTNGPASSVGYIAIPGTVQEAMEHLTGDVHVGHNVLNARWIEEETWLLSRTFSLSDTDIADGQRVRLVLEGIALYATVFVNGKVVGEHHNFYTPCRIDITDQAVAGENTLDIKIESGLLANAFKHSTTAMNVPSLPSSSIKRALQISSAAQAA